MSKRTIYTIVTPLPPTISRRTALDALHEHSEMIQLNPMVISHIPCPPATNAPPDEFHSIWYALTDRVSYLPGIKGNVTYKACFHDLPNGLQTHVYAPAGLEIREKWSVGGNEAGEPREVLELGLVGAGVPRDGLYLREDVDMRCSYFLTSFVKKNLRRAHQVLVERLVVKADLEEDRRVRSQYIDNGLPSLTHSSWSPSMASQRSSYGPGGVELPASPRRLPRGTNDDAPSSPAAESSHSGSMYSDTNPNGPHMNSPYPRSERNSLQPQYRTASSLGPPSPPANADGRFVRFHSDQGYQGSRYDSPRQGFVPHSPSGYYQSQALDPNIAELPGDYPVYIRQHPYHEEQMYSYLAPPASGEKRASGTSSPYLGPVAHPRLPELDPGEPVSRDGRAPSPAPEVPERAARRCGVVLP